MSVFGRFLVVLSLALLATSRSSVGADVFAEVTAGHDRVITPEYFGIHFHRLGARPQEGALRTNWPALSFGSLRLWDAGTRWADVAPKAGQWDFEQMDTYVSEAKAHDASVLYTLGSTPRWASARPDEPCSYGFGCGAEPVRFAHWEEYVRRVARRYQGLVGAYELWNEPHFSDLLRDRAQPVAFFSGRIADMVEMAHIARRVLDETSPGAILTTPGVVGDTEHLSRFLGAGGKAYVQAVTYHFYTKDVEEFVDRILKVRKVMRQHGVENLPLWNTELGIEVYPENSPLPLGAQRFTRREAATRMAQVLVLGAAAGLERFYYYTWDNVHSGMVTPHGERLPAYEAMARIQAWLIGSRMKGCASPSRGVVNCRVESGKQVSLIAWSSRPGEQSLKLPDGMKVGGVETLLSGTPLPVHRVRPGFVQIALGPEPVRITLDQRGQP